MFLLHYLDLSELCLYRDLSELLCNSDWRRVFCRSLQKSDPGQVLLDAVFKHLELTERDYFGLHLADDSLDSPVSRMVFDLQERFHQGTNGS